MPRAKHFDIVIAGGGVIGMSIALRLSERKVRVAVIDNALPGQATHAAAGMLAPLAEAGAEGPLLDLGLASLEKYARFVEQISELAQAPLKIEGRGVLRIARNEEEAKQLQALFRRPHSPLPLELLADDRLREVEPLLTPSVLLAVLSLAERHIHPRRLLEILKKASTRLGVELYSGEAVTRIEHDGSEIRGVHTAARMLSCGCFVICGGAWSDAVAKMLPNSTLPVTPLKGQIASLDASGSSPLRYTIHTQDRYLVPRDNGELVVGATEDPDAGFDPGTHPDAISRLRLDAEALVHAVSGLPLLSAWSGLRPASPDGLPMLGRLAHWTNVYTAAGHGRGGILLAPHTADLLAECILDGQDPPKAFAPQRFERLS